MENVNLKNARQGTSTEAKQGKTEHQILAVVFRRWDKVRIGNSDAFSEEHSVSVSFYKNTLTNETRHYRVTGLSTVECLMAQELKSRDLVEVRYSEDGKEVVEMEKFGRLYFDDELEK